MWKCAPVGCAYSRVGRTGRTADPVNRILQRAAADRRTLSRPTKERPTKGRQKERHWASGKLAVALATLRRGWEVAWCGRVVGWVWWRGVRGEGVAVQAQVATHYTTCAHSFPDSCTLNVQGNSPNKPLLNQGEGKGRVWQARSASKSPTRFCSPAFPSALSRCVCRE